MPKVMQPRRQTTTSVEPPQISSPSCCGRCLYNIPQGTLVILMPGTVILLIGSFMTSLTKADSSYDDDLAYVSWLFLALGAVTTTVGIVFWSVLWTRNKPPPLPPKYRPTSPTESVQLVGVYKISDGHVNRAHTDDSGHANRAPGDNDRTSHARAGNTDHASRTRAIDTAPAITSSDVSHPRTDSLHHVTSEHTNGDGHVNRAHTDDDGNVDPALSDDKGASAGASAGAGYDGHTNAPQTDDEGRGRMQTV